MNASPKCWPELACAHAKATIGHAIRCGELLNEAKARMGHGEFLPWLKLRFKGTPREIGFAAGRALGVRLEQTVNHYIAGMEDSTEMEKLYTGADDSVEPAIAWRWTCTTGR